MNNNGFIKIYRSMLDWEWWSDMNTFRLFMFLLLSSSFKPSKFQGQNIPIGSVILTQVEMSAHTNLTVRQVRVALEHLKLTGEVTQLKTPKFTITTLNNYSKYQDDGRAMTEQRQSDDRAMTEQRQSDDSSTIYKECKKVKNDKNVIREESTPTSSALTPEQKIILVSDFGLALVESYLTKMRNWQSRKRIKNVDEFVTLTKWLNEDKEKNAAVPVKADSESSFDIGEIERLEAEKLMK